MFGIISISTSTSIKIMYFALHFLVNLRQYAYADLVFNSSCKIFIKLMRKCASLQECQVIIICKIKCKNKITATV